MTLHKRRSFMNIKKKIGVAAMALSVLLAGNVFATEKWMTGDFHNHTTYTDGSWPMNDLTRPAPSSPPPFRIPAACTGRVPRPLPSETVSTSLQLRTRRHPRTGTASVHSITRPFTPASPAIDDADPRQMWRWQSSPSDIRHLRLHRPRIHGRL